MAADPWTTMAKLFERDASTLRARAAGVGAVGDSSSLLLEAERLEHSAARQRELAVIHGCGSARWGSSRPEPSVGGGPRAA